MITWGICTNLKNAAAAKAAGWDFVEENVQGLLQGQLPDAEWKQAADVAAAVLPVPSANALVPGSLKLVGPEVDHVAIDAYLENVGKRAGTIGMNRLAFGSAGARNLPDGFDRAAAKVQLIDFVKRLGRVGEKHGVTFVVEPLNRKESNIINSVAEAMEYVRAADHPNLQCLVDSYHLWLEDEPLTNLEAAMPWIKHVHLADKVGRTPPGKSGQSDYRPFFAVLKKGNYDGGIAVEASNFDIAADGVSVLQYLKTQWNDIAV